MKKLVIVSISAAIAVVVISNAQNTYAASTTYSGAYAEYDKKGSPWPDYSEGDQNEFSASTSATADTTRSHASVSTGFGVHHAYAEASNFLDQYSSYSRGYSETWEEFFWAGSSGGIGTMALTYTLNGTLFASGTSAVGASVNFSAEFDPNDDLSGSFDHPVSLVDFYDQVSCGSTYGFNFCGGEDVNLITTTAPFEFPYNEPFVVESILDIAAWTSWDIGNTGFAMADFQNTVALTGVMIDGAPVSITGASGVTYPIEYVAVDAAPVPIPATMLLFSSGLAGLAAVRRRKK